MNYFLNLISYLSFTNSTQPIKWGLGIGDWGLGIGGWGPNPKTPKPTPKTHTPI